jgi:hypothetical protein
MSDPLQGRRRPDLVFSDIHSDLQAGDYWKILDTGTGLARVPDPPQPGNLTGTCWYVVAPLGDDTRSGPARLEAHTVREEDDGTISVRPGDGSSNSILVTGAHGRTWHGYIEHGVWSEC